MDESQPLLLKLTVWQRALRIRQHMHQEAERDETDRWGKLVDAGDASAPAYGAAQEIPLENRQQNADADQMGDQSMRWEQWENRKYWGEWSDGDNFADWYDRTR